jgi:hypothetical protein
MFERDHAVRHSILADWRKGHCNPEAGIDFAPVQIAKLDNRSFKPGLRDPPHRRGPDAASAIKIALVTRIRATRRAVTKEGACSTTRNHRSKTSNAPHAR